MGNGYKNSRKTIIRCTLLQMGGKEWGLFRHVVDLCLHYFWAEPAQFSDSKLEPPPRIYVWVWFAVWVLIFLTNDMWQVAQWIQCCLPAQNYGISHHSMNTVPDQRGSKRNPCILFKSLFYSLFYYKVSNPNCPSWYEGNNWLYQLSSHRTLLQTIGGLFIQVVIFFFFVFVYSMILHPVRAQGAR